MNRQPILTPAMARRLVRTAAAARRAAYAPYSRYRVGAALWGADGTCHAGCNIENASYGLTLCAERTALAAAVAARCRRFLAVAIVADGRPAPCGACLQVLAEFCAPDTPILLAAPTAVGRYEQLTLRALLPRQFVFAQDTTRLSGRLL